MANSIENMNNVFPLLRLYRDQGINVKIEGKRGTGKTSVINEIFQEKWGEQGGKWRSFSGGTMDPFLELIGVPIKREVNGELTLEYIRPKDLNEDTVEALFIDEYNRSPQSVRNALMELCQFKSVNGRKFPKLKIVWCAINPSDSEDDYQVEALDPAQEERFQVTIEFPFEPHKPYFVKKHGAFGVKAIDWWTSLNPTNKNLVSPRVLDQAIDIYKIGGEVRHVIRKFDPATLIQYLNEVGIKEELEQHLGNEEKAKVFINNPNKFNKALSLVAKTNSYVDFYGPLMNEEFKTTLAGKSGYAKEKFFPPAFSSTKNPSSGEVSVTEEKEWKPDEFPFNLPESSTYQRKEKLKMLERYLHDDKKHSSISYVNNTIAFLKKFLRSSQNSTIQGQKPTIESIFYNCAKIGKDSVTASITSLARNYKLTQAGINIDVNLLKLPAMVVEGKKNPIMTSQIMQEFIQDLANPTPKASPYKEIPF